MRIAVSPDVHSNLPALEVVLGDIERAGPDERYALGDLVGYVLAQRIPRATEGRPTRVGSERCARRSGSRRTGSGISSCESTGLPAEFADQLREARGYRA